MILAGLLHGGALPKPAQAAEVTELGYSLTPSETEPYAACPGPASGFFECMGIIVPPRAAKPTSSLRALPGQASSSAGASQSAGLSEGSGEGGGWAPSDLRSAYRLPASGGSGQTVAIVDAFDDPHAEADLKVYRSHYGLSECTTANGCFAKVNQKGEEKNYPLPPSGEFIGWSAEISLDVDMVSAVCPSCHILLVEATNSDDSNLDAAEDEAVTLKATEISDSWDGPETAEETSEDKYFEHPGIPITVAAGDKGYDHCEEKEEVSHICYPAAVASKNVIAVGGTTLYKTPFYERGWFEQAWQKTGSGCSLYEPKPAWQTDTGCIKRMDDDVAAVADPESPVSIYATYEESGWMLEGGTSVAAPIVAGIEALSSSTVRSEGAETFYRHSEFLFDVTTGYNSSACSHEYFCTAETGYDGPTGNGTTDLEGGGEGLLGKWMSVSPSGPNGHSSSVSCTASNACIAVGGSGVGYPVVDTWNGTEWSSMGASIARPAEATEVKLLGVSCTASSACTAVGRYNESLGTAVTLAEVWNGTEWKVQSTPNPTGAKSSELFGVSCSSSTACEGVGYYKNSSGVFVAFAESWNGTEWKVQSTPIPTGAGPSFLKNVSCVSSTACTAVGKYFNSSNVGVALAEVWNGTEWKVQATSAPAGARSSGFEGVSCASSSACTAVGTFESSSNVQTILAERWNGTEWSVQTIPTPKEARASNLSGVSCASTSACTAVGKYTVSVTGTPELSVAESWNGTAWSVQELPTTGGIQNTLTGVSCTSSTVCMATGFLVTTQHFPYSAVEADLTYSSSGATWSREPVPSTNAGTAVSCSSTTACTAVGSVAGEGEGTAEMWNGAVWSNSSTKRPSGAAGMNLAGISCTSRYECTAVGSYVNSSGIRVSLAERLTKPNGAEPEIWKVQTTPNPAGAKASVLAGVSCISSSSCTAIGQYTNSAGVVVTLGEAWNGTEWKEQSTPNPAGAKASVLAGVSCISSSSCTAVGQYTNSAGVVVTLGEAWNGTEWTIQTTSNPTGAKASSLEAVSCALSGKCIAVGSYANSSGVVVTLAEMRTGTEWTVQTTTDPVGAATSVLKGVSCTVSSLCLAVGSSTNASSQITSVSEVFSGPVLPIVTTKPATSITNTGATINGVVNPKGVEAKYDFEYGTTTSYGTKTAEASTGSGTSGLEENKAVTGLIANTTYHVRIVATNVYGTVVGNDQVFTTLPNAPENIELPVASPTTPDQAVPESTTTGAWTNEPTGYAYQWERCNTSGEKCENILGATSVTYTPVEADVEHTLVVKVTAQNSGGEGFAFSKATSRVKPIGQITEYSLPSGSYPSGVTAGPDGNVWFTESDTHKIGKVTTAGVVTEYGLTSGAYPSAIAVGSDKNLWFADNDPESIGKITTSGTVTEYSLPGGTEPEGVTEGADGNLWFIDLRFDKIGKITTSGTITEYSLPEKSYPYGITAGPDGDVWFTEAGAEKIGKINPSTGAITEYSLPAHSWPWAIAAGPDGNLWFTDFESNKIGKITTSGTVAAEYSLPAGSGGEEAITAGPDGNLWFTNKGTDKVGKITTSGTITEYALPTESNPYGIAVGPDDNIWYTDLHTNKMGKITP